MIHPPFTFHFEAAVLLAHTALAVCLGAALWQRPFANFWSNLLFAVAILCALGALTQDHNAEVWVYAAGLLQLVAAYIALPWRAAALVAVVSATIALPVTVPTLVALHLWSTAVLLALHLRRERDTLVEAPARPKEDVWIFVGATSLAAVTCFFLFAHAALEGDSIANTFQAKAFARGMTWAPTPICERAYEWRWIFPYGKRAFAQYTPGWPLFLALFERVGVPSLASPVAYGAMAVAVARLARRMSTASGTSALIAGRVAAVSLIGYTAVANGATRFSHALLSATFAWSAEALCALCDDRPRRQKLTYSLVLGCGVGLMLITRPTDGVMLGVGLLFFAATALASRRLALRDLVPAALLAGAWIVVALIILRLQIGVWFKTGYSLAPIFHPGNGGPKFSLPSLVQLTPHLALATGSYTWWPCAPALGTLGLMCARGRARAIAAMLGLSSCALWMFYCTLEWFRSPTGIWAFGHRHHLPIQVAMAVGGGVLFSQMHSRAGSGARAPLRLASAALAIGTLAVAPLLYPATYDWVLRQTEVPRAIARAQLHNSIVLVRQGPQFDALDALFGEIPDVLILINTYPLGSSCAATLFKGRDVYYASPPPNVHLTLIHRADEGLGSGSP